MKTPDEKLRKVDLSIQQKNGFAIFKVTNAIAENPVYSGNTLKSTKHDGNPLHGLGLRNIQDTAEKYNGSMVTDIHDNCFTSTVLMCFTPGE